MDLKGLKITWLGHSAFSIVTPAGKAILVDPWLAGNPKCPEALHQPAAIDAILITHGHADHVGNTLDLHQRCSGPIVGNYELTCWLGTKGVAADKLVGMNKGGTVRLDAVSAKVTMTDAHHSSSWTEEDGTVVYLGEPAGFVLAIDAAPRIFIAGDTCVFGDMALIRELYRPQLALLPIGDHFTMDPREAAYATKLLGVEAVVPCHYGTFPMLTGTPERLQAQLAELGVSAEVLAPQPGGTVN